VNDFTLNGIGSESYMVVVSAAKGYLLSALEEQFKQAGYNIVTVNSIAGIERIDGSIQGFFLFLEEALVDDIQLQVYIRDKATEEGYPVFVTGNLQEIKDVKNIIPEHLFQAEFPRPVNVKDIIVRVDKYYEENDVSEQKIILAVDDSGVMLNSIKNWLSDKYQVMLADSGVAAIKYITLKRPDLIILDYEMPIIDGKQTLAMIRSERDFADIPVIFLTGRQDKESIMEVMEYKPAGYLLKTMKPFDVHKYVDDFFAKQEAQQKADSLRKLMHS